MLFATTKIIRQVVTFGFQRIVVFVFHLTTRPTGRYDLRNVVGGNCMVASECISVNPFTVVADCGQFTPVDHQRLVAIAQRNLDCKAIVIGVAAFTLSAFDAKRFNGAESSMPASHS